MKVLPYTLRPLLEYIFFCFPFIPENGDSERERNLSKVMYLVSDKPGVRPAVPDSTATLLLVFLSIPLSSQVADMEILEKTMGP